MLSSIKKLNEIEKEEEEENSINYRKNIKLVVINIFKMCCNTTEEFESSFNLTGNIVCIFIDYMRLIAPSKEFNNDILQFYLNLIVKWLQNYSGNILNVSDSVQTK